MAFPAIVGMGIPAVVGEVPLTDVTRMALQAVAEGVPSAVCFREPLLAVAKVDPLFPCGRRLVSADSSPLLVRGELDMTVVFPGLSCSMVLVVASIGSEGLLGRRPCSRVWDSVPLLSHA